MSEQVIDLELAEISTRKYIVCPNCNAEASWVDHCFDKKAPYYPISTAWYCDGCGKQYRVELIDDKLYTGLTGRYKEDCYVVLEYEGLFLIVKGIYFDGEFDKENKAYFYNKHTCPSNFLGRTDVFYKGDSDPHGIFEFRNVFKIKEEAWDYVRELKGENH